jgi:hypothetical protein
MTKPGDDTRPCDPQNPVNPVTNPAKRHQAAGLALGKGTAYPSPEVAAMEPDEKVPCYWNATFQTVGDDRDAGPWHP